MRARRIRRAAAVACVFGVAGWTGSEGPAADAKQLNGFDLSNAVIPIEEILPGGPPRDGIPALSHPRFVAAADAPWNDQDMVVGVVHEGEARAYPLAILVWHELVNDRIADRPILVSYCPLCGSAIVFDRRPAGAGGRDGKPLEFGVSGLLYQSDLLMFDRETDTLWSQIAGRAVAGPMTGGHLEILRARILPWGSWRARHPRTRVLSPDTGARRAYGRTPYPGYDRSRELYFPVDADRRYHPKMRTVGLRMPSGKSRAYPQQEVEAAGSLVEEAFAGRRVVVAWNAQAEAFEVEAPPEVVVIESFWFAWMAFHPESSVYRAERAERP
ncbi:MAG: DUF3179 domain-containing protein [Deltaproteobacteria bacterium]|nr:DUF3179 domain-containing protein [Deltaproteobacteria bacterium]